MRLNNSISSNGRLNIPVADHHLHHQQAQQMQRGSMSMSNGNNGNMGSGGGGGGVLKNNSNDSVANNKGIVFSRSFEYDTRKGNNNGNYPEVFSKSFDYDLSAPATVTTKPQQQAMSLLQIHRNRTPAFSNLTGNSPSYLTKKDSENYNRPSNNNIVNSSNNSSAIGNSSAALRNRGSREASPSNQVMQGARMYSSQSPEGGGKGTYHQKSIDAGRSRRAQFSRLRNESSNSSASGGGGGVGRGGFGSVEVSTINRRLNSCDSEGEIGDYKFLPIEVP